MRMQISLSSSPSNMLDECCLQVVTSLVLLEKWTKKRLLDDSKKGER